MAGPFGNPRLSNKVLLQDKLRAETDKESGKPIGPLCLECGMAQSKAWGLVASASTPQLASQRAMVDKKFKAELKESVDIDQGRISKPFIEHEICSTGECEIGLTFYHELVPVKIFEKECGTKTRDIDASVESLGDGNGNSASGVVCSHPLFKHPILTKTYRVKVQDNTIVMPRSHHLRKDQPSESYKKEDQENREGASEGSAQARWQREDAVDGSVDQKRPGSHRGRARLRFQHCRR